MDFTISEDVYEKYRQKQGSISNSRVRPENQTFFDAMMSVDMNATPGGREILEAIKQLD
jgi:hypothetical protein